MTSGGVASSLPGQNGQRAGSWFPENELKEVGRCFRSLDMITQRPVMGSRRNSGISVSDQAKV